MAAQPPVAAITFRPLAAADLNMLHGWLQRPHVAEWWRPTPTAQEVAAEFGELLRPESSTRAFLASVEREAIGYIQSYVALGSGEGWWEAEGDPGVRGIDQFLADPARLGTGLGTAMVRAFVRRLFDDPRVTAVQVDPSPANGRAIRCYEKAGFRAIGEVETPDGRALLMRQTRAEHDGRG